MPAKVVKPKSSGAVQRSRTGCQTCRSRKLKCDEAKPICGQCLKSHRDCVRSDAITFRHHQNSSFGKDGQDHALDSFFKYSQAYTADDVKNFLPVPQSLTWIHVSDPSADDASVATPPAQTPATPDTYQQVAAHTLEALSTAAADHTSYPPQGTAYYTAATPQTESNPEYGFVRIESGPASGNNASGNMNYVLTHATTQSQTLSSMIDPNLEATVAQAVETAGETDNTAESTFQPEDHDGKDKPEQEESMADSDSRVAMALRSFNETPA